MFQLSEKFFKDLGLKGMPKEFWKYSVISKPTNKTMTCTASAEDFFNKKDFRYHLINKYLFLENLNIILTHLCIDQKFSESKCVPKTW
jgi:hypothetical protein